MLQHNYNENCLQSAVDQSQGKWFGLMDEVTSPLKIACVESVIRAIFRRPDIDMADRVQIYLTRKSEKVK